MRGVGDRSEEDTEEGSDAAPMMFVEQPPRLDGRSASDVLQLLQALIDTIEDDYAEVLERYGIAEAQRMHDQAMAIEYELEDDDDGECSRQFELALTDPDDF